MIIQLPDHLQRSLKRTVHSGHFSSLDEAMAEAVRLLLRELGMGQEQFAPQVNESNPDPVLGCMGDDAELMDEIVADAYRHRKGETWRDLDL